MPTLTQHIEPMANFLLLRRCTRATVEEVDGRRFYMEDGVALPERIGDFSNQAIILAAGPKCKAITKREVDEANAAGKPLRIWVREGCQGLHRVEGEDFMIKDDAEGIIPITLQE